MIFPKKENVPQAKKGMLNMASPSGLGPPYNIGPVNWFLYFSYGLMGMSLWFWGKVLGWKLLIDLSSVLENAQFVGLVVAWKESSWRRK